MKTRIGAVMDVFVLVVLVAIAASFIVETIRAVEDGYRFLPYVLASATVGWVIALCVFVLQRWPKR